MTPMNKKSRVKCATIHGRKSYIDWTKLPGGEFRDDVVKPEVIQKATLAGHERASRSTRSWGRGSRVIKRDLEKSKFYGE